MLRFTAVLATAAVAALQVACYDSGQISQPEQKTRSTASYSLASSTGGGGVHRVEIRDACDPISFDAVFGLGTCVRSGGRNLSDFLAEVSAKQEAGAWRFASANIEARVGQTLLAINRGGEKHTFTEVKEFGGGNNPILNELSHNPNVAPECAASTTIAAGASQTDELDEEGTERYQCCIHPWMRTTVKIRGRA